MKNLKYYILSSLFLSSHHLTFAQTSSLEQISESPRMFIIPDFLSEEECDYVISYAKPEMNRSTIFDERTNQRKIDPARTSTSMRCADLHGDEIIQQIEKKISEITSIPESQGENIQVAHYAIGAQYRPHYDYFQKTSTQEGGQRIATFLIYLNTPTKGGETKFPRANISIKPIKGSALFFYNVNPEGFVDHLSLHAGTPVIEGEKWIMTRWFRERDL